MSNKIIGYSYIPADKIRAGAAEQEIKTVRCIPLSEIQDFSMIEMPNVRDLKIIYNEGFILKEIIEDPLHGEDLFIFEKQ